MEEETKPRIKKRPTTDDCLKPVHIIASGSLVASIYLRQAPSGYAYYAYNLKRTYQSLTTRNQIHSTDFFSENESDIVSVVTEASHWIAKASERGRQSLQNAA